MCILKILSEIIAILVNNAFKTVQQSAKDKEDICRRADARQRYLTQDFTLWWAGLRCIILEDCYNLGIVMKVYFPENGCANMKNNKIYFME